MTISSNFLHALDSIGRLKPFTDREGTQWKHVRTDSRGRHYWEKTGYQHKPSKRTILERQERDRVLQARLRAEGNKAELMCLAYGGRPLTDDGKLLVSGWKADMQREAQAHTTKGDFSHLHANPLICK